MKGGGEFFVDYGRTYYDRDDDTMLDDEDEDEVLEEKSSKMHKI